MQEVIGAATQAMADLRWNSVVSALGLSSDLVVPPTVDLSKLTIRLLADFSEPVSQAESLLHKPNLPVDLYEDLIYSGERTGGDHWHHCHICYIGVNGLLVG